MNNAAIPPITNKRIIISIKEIISPATAIPRGALNNPKNDNSAPKIQKIQPRPGTHPKNRPSNAKINPALPTPFVCCCTIMVVGC